MASATNAGNGLAMARDAAAHALCTVRAWPSGKRRLAGTVAILAVTVATTLILAGGGSSPSGTPRGPALVVVAPQLLIQRLSLVGTVEPGGIVAVIAPFDGTIKEKLVEFGTQVEKGQALLVLDTTEIELQMREAEAVTIKAERAAEDMKAWANTPDVLRARNAVIAAQMKVEELERKEAESKALLARGIIPRIEYDGIMEQLKAQRLQLTSARQELDTALQRGDAEHRRLASLELETAGKRLAELKRRMEAGLVEAPVPGLLLRPASSESKGSSAPAEIEIGSRVGKGQPMFSVADTATLRVIAHVDEIDVNRIVEGMAVEAVGEAFGSLPITGRVTRISAQAAAGGSASRSPTFEVVVSLSPPSDEVRRRIRVGMSAALSIVTYQNPAALVVPAAAIRGAREASFVVLRESDTGRDRSVPVTPGRSTEDGVEVLAGLKSGDTVVVEAGGGLVPLPSGGLTPAVIGPPGLGRL